MRPLHHPRADELSLQAVLYALSDTARLGIVRRLARDGPQTCGGSCDLAVLPRATLSRHFDVLRNAGLVTTRKVGTRYQNALRCDDLEARFPGLLGSVLAAAARDERPQRPRSARPAAASRARARD